VKLHCESKRKQFCTALDEGRSTCSDRKKAVSLRQSVKRAG
jgi:hypothetical protein